MRSLAISAILLLLLPTTAGAVPWSHFAEPIVIVDIRETEIKLNSTYEEPLEVTFNGSVEVEKPFYHVGDVRVELSSTVDDDFSSMVEPDNMVFTGSDIKDFVLTVIVPQETELNLTIVRITCIAESINGRAIREDTAILTLEHAETGDNVGNGEGNGGGGSEGKDDGGTVSMEMNVLMCGTSIAVAIASMMIALFTKRKGLLKDFSWKHRK